MLNLVHNAVNRWCAAVHRVEAVLNQGMAVRNQEGTVLKEWKVGVWFFFFNT
jgi:hypothetical protein